MVDIQETIDTLLLLQSEGYTNLNVTMSDGYDSVDADGVYFNKGILTDGTKVIDLDITTTLTNKEKQDDNN